MLLFFAGLCAGSFSRTVEPPLEPALPPLLARTDSDIEVIMNTAAAIVVALERTVAEPRGPKAVWEPMPPKAPAKSAALPLCSRTTPIKTKHTRT